MEMMTSLFDLLLHIDKTMLQFIETHGAWIYLLLVLIIFAETGLVFEPVFCQGIPYCSLRALFVQWVRWISC